MNETLFKIDSSRELKNKISLYNELKRLKILFYLENHSLFY